MPCGFTYLMNMYINQQIQVKWNNAISKQSNIKNGVKQGRCLSPSLFSVYLNKLIEILRTSNVGCRSGLGSSTVDQVLKYTKYPKYIPSTSTGQVLIFFKKYLSTSSTLISSTSTSTHIKICSKVRMTYRAE